MTITIIYRLAGEPYTENEAPFKDVNRGQYYTEAIDWAFEHGIVKGYTEESFGPGDPVTREQIAAIIMNFVKYMGYDVNIEDTDISNYGDAAEVSCYAVPAVRWACESGITKGNEGKLLPQNTASRAEAAAIFHRLCEQILK